ncbi:hypothetical protein PCE1_000859 [Barthelona sp. PCE]
MPHSPSPAPNTELLLPPEVLEDDMMTSVSPKLTDSFTRLLSEFTSMHKHHCESQCNSYEDEINKHSAALVAIHALVDYVEFSATLSDADYMPTTFMALKRWMEDVFVQAARVLFTHSIITENTSDPEKHRTHVSFRPGIELFIRFIKLACVVLNPAEHDLFSAKKQVLDAARKWYHRASTARHRMVKFANPFIREHCKVLVFGFSRNVLALIAEASRRTEFTVDVLECAPSRNGHKMFNMIKTIPGMEDKVTLYPDTYMGSIMHRCDLALVGAEAVLESGGIYNQIGTYQLSITANHLKIPLYVCVESHKMMKEFPLFQSDVPGFKPITLDNVTTFSKYDYTPPELITLYFTDIGAITPAEIDQQIISLSIGELIE